MKPTKPDRWERIVKERMEKDGGLWSDSAADLLRKEHAAVVRMIRKVNAWQCEQLADNEDAFEVILDQLKRRAQ